MRDPVAEAAADILELYDRGAPDRITVRALF
jgi:hypothetical protein